MNATQVNANLYALFESHFPAGAEQPLLVIPNGPVVHYDDIAALSAQIAHALVAAGCRKGDRVAVQTAKHWQVLALYLACLRAGLVYLPLNTGYQRSELDYFFGDAEPRVIVCGPEHLGLVATLARGATVLTLDAHGGELIDRAADCPTTFATVESAPDDLAAILYTSGTTGRSKGAMLTHRNLASNALALVEAWGFTRGDVLLHALPIYHVHGLFVAIHCVLLSGSHMLWLPKFDAAEVVGAAPAGDGDDGRADVLLAAGVRAPFTRETCRTIRLFVSGSAPLLPETFDAFRERTGQTILERYGMTETGMNTSNPLVGARVAGTVGTPLSGIEMRVVGDDGASLAAGTHRRRAGARAERVRRLLAHAGEDARGIHRGRLLQDRRHGRVGCRRPGTRLSAPRRPRQGPHHHRRPQRLSEGNRGADRRDGRRDRDRDHRRARSRFRRVRHGGRGRAPGHALTEGGIIAALKGEIASFKVPKRVHFVADLPRNAMGKVQKNLLRQEFAPPAKA